MSKVSILRLLIGLFVLSLVAINAGAQRRSKTIRPPARRQEINGSNQNDPQFRSRKNRLPAIERGVDRSRFPDQVGRNRTHRRRILFETIGLTVEQEGRLREINLRHDDQNISAGRRLRQARDALDRAYRSEQYDELAVRRATEELVAAQADKIRLVARIRSEVRNVLTSEQMKRLNELERQMRREKIQQQREQEK